MTIRVNGLKKDFVEGETISKLLKRMKYVFPMVIVKIDGELVQNEDFKATTFEDGAVIEVIHLTSGG